MREIKKDDILALLANRKADEIIDLSEVLIQNAELSGLNLDNINFKGSDFKNVNFINASLQNCDLSHIWAEEISFAGANLSGSNLHGANLRRADLSKTNVSGVNFYRSVLERAKLGGIIDDEKTQFFRMVCPEEGAFQAYKKCYGDRVLKLLVPKDAKRSTATGRTCRCSKVKVLAIESIDLSEKYDSAESYAKEGFYYYKGQMAYPDRFDEDRWSDSSHGIHVFFTREEAIGYL